MTVMMSVFNSARISRPEWAWLAHPAHQGLESRGSEPYSLFTLHISALACKSQGHHPLLLNTGT